MGWMEWNDTSARSENKENRLDVNKESPRRSGIVRHGQRKLFGSGAQV